MAWFDLWRCVGPSVDRLNPRATGAGNVLILPIVADAEFPRAVGDNATRIRIAGILMVLNSLCVVAIGVLLYPLLSQVSSFVAPGYVAARIIESVVLLIGVISILSLIGIANEHAEHGSAGVLYALALGKSAINTNWYAYHVSMAALGPGSLLFCKTLFQRRLIPVYLSILGFVGYAVLGASSLLAILDVDLGLAVTAPVFLFEVILGIWLIFKGFDAADARAF